jgi:hypothetical protein
MRSYFWNPSLRRLLAKWNDGVAGDVMARADDFRRYAAECLALAQRALDLNDRARLLDMANAFNRLAAKAEAQDDPTEK